MNALLIILIIHLLLVVACFLMALDLKEKQWLLFAGIALIPILGPVVIIIAYVLARANQIADEQYKREKLNSSSKQ